MKKLLEIQEDHLQKNQYHQTRVITISFWKIAGTYDDVLIERLLLFFVLVR